MRNLIKSIVFLFVPIVFTNIVSAQNWPVFTTKDTQSHIKIDHTQLLNTETKFYDDLYRYDLDLNQPNLELLNVLLICSHVDINLVPSDKESIENKATYIIYMDDKEVAKIDVKRKNH